MTPDSWSYINYSFPDIERMPFYPWFLQLGDTIILQIMLWVITGWILHKHTGFGILWFATIGLITLTQKILPETLFVFVLALATTSKKDMTFVWICVAYFVKPVILFFIPIMLLSRPRWQYIVVGLIPVISYSVVLYWKHGIWMSVNGIDTLHQYTHNLGDYIQNIVTNSWGKSVGLKNYLLVRISQIQTFTYTIISITAAWFWRKKTIYLLPTYLVLISGIAGKQGDRLHIVMVPICLMFLYDLFRWTIPLEFKKIKYTPIKWNQKYSSI